MKGEEQNKKIKVLMLVTSFAPDSIIAAVRPSMFARYLSKDKFDITIVRSGRIDGKADDSLWQYVKQLRIISYEGEDAPAERYMRAQYSDKAAPMQATPHFQFLKGQVMRKFLHVLYDPFRYMKYALTERKKIKTVIDSQLKGESFDVIFATYGDIGNVLVSHYASRVLGGRLIIDLRDPICVQFQSCLLRLLTTCIQQTYLCKTDLVTCVTQGLTDDMKKIVGNKAILLYNGYVPEEDVTCEKGEISSHSKDVLTLFYGGNMYEGKREFSALFSAICDLVKEEKVDLSHIRFIYAGASFDVIEKQAGKYGVQDILDNRGYVSRMETDYLQKSSDIFLVATWNMTKEEGVMPGKFYESIRNQMPIIATVTGNKCNSEIGKIIKQYDLGACYEQADHEHTYYLLKEYLLKQYKSKMEKGRVEYVPKDGATQKFSYKYLSTQLAEIIESVVL